MALVIAINSPWYYKEELRNFSKVTKGKGNNAIIMGKTPGKVYQKDHCLVELILFYQVLLIVLLTLIILVHGL